MKTRFTIFTLILITALFVGCSQTPKQPQVSTSPQASAPSNQAIDVKTSASIVDQAAAFEKAISSSGTWIIAITKDLTISKDLVLEGEYKNGKKDDKGNDIIQRKLALYAQDENRNITARYTLTIPKLTVKSPKASIQHGTLKGDLYVDVKDFELIDATIDGNVYFTTEEYQSTFKMDNTSKITGKKELKK